MGGVALVSQIKLITSSSLSRRFADTIFKFTSGASIEFIIFEKKKSYFIYFVYKLKIESVLNQISERVLRFLRHLEITLLKKQLEILAFKKFKAIFSLE